MTPTEDGEPSHLSHPFRYDLHEDLAPLTTMPSSSSSTPSSTTTSSNPSSPLLSSHIVPRWLKKPRHIPIASPRHIVKLAPLAMLCIMSGWSVAGLYDADSAAMALDAHGRRPAFDDVMAMGKDGRLRQVDDGQRFGYLQEAAAVAKGVAGTGRGYANGFSTANPGSSDGETSSSGSFVTGISNKLSSLNPFSKLPSFSFSSASTLDKLYTNNALQQTSEYYTPVQTPTGDIPTLAKVTILTGGDNTVYERALRTHRAHNLLHGYPMHILRQSILNDVWSKPAYILSVLLRELAKPRAERVPWLFWVDADTIIINPNVPAEVFLPPVGFDDIHLLISHDYNGLNNGVFPIRVHPWSVELLCAVIAYPAYRPDEHLLFRDQSAMAELLKEPKFSRHTARAPQRWFNAYEGEINDTIAPFQTRPGDLLVHFAGVPERDERMNWWLRRVELHLPEWEVEFEHTSYKSETRDFWAELDRKRSSERVEAKKLKAELEERRMELEDAIVRYGGNLTEGGVGKVEKALEKSRVVLEDEDLKGSVDAIRLAMIELREGAQPLQKLLDKERQITLTEAQDALFAAEKSLRANEGVRGTSAEYRKLQVVIAHFKETLLSKSSRTDAIGTELQILREKEEQFLRKVEFVRGKGRHDGGSKRINDMPKDNPKPEAAQDESAEDEPAEDEPAEDEPAEDELAEDEPAEDEPAENEPPEAEVVEDVSAEAELVEAVSAEAEFVEDKPVEVESAVDEPDNERKKMIEDPVESQPEANYVTAWEPWEVGHEDGPPPF